jgi:hypothetical protein
MQLVCATWTDECSRRGQTNARDVDRRMLETWTDECSRRGQTNARDVDRRMLEAGEGTSLNVEQKCARHQAIYYKALLLFCTDTSIHIGARVHYDGAPLAQIVIIHDLIRANVAAVAVRTLPRHLHSRNCRSATTIVFHSLRIVLHGMELHVCTHCEEAVTMQQTTTHRERYK